MNNNRFSNYLGFYLINCASCFQVVAHRSQFIYTRVTKDNEEEEGAAVEGGVVEPKKKEQKKGKKEKAAEKAAALEEAEAE